MEKEIKLINTIANEIYHDLVSSNIPTHDEFSSSSVRLKHIMKITDKIVNNKIIIKKALYNLLDKTGLIYAQEKWTWTDNGYLVEIKYCQEFEVRDWIEAKPNMSYKRELVSLE